MAGVKSMFCQLCMMISVMVQVALLQSIQEAAAYGMYQDRIPNGHNVKDPANPSRDWPAIGHVTSSGGDLNPFGIDFNNQGRRWTIELCHMDSDGDGSSNGMELGDPECQWRPGQQPKRTTDITHPGMKGDVKRDAARQDSAASLRKAEDEVAKVFVAAS